MRVECDSLSSHVLLQSSNPHFLTMPNTTSTFAERMRLARKISGLTQITLAQKTHLSVSTVASMEKDKFKGSASVVQIALAMGVEPLWLASGEGPMQKVEEAKDPLARLQSGLAVIEEYLDNIPSGLERAARDSLANWMSGSIELEALLGILNAMAGTKATAQAGKALESNKAP